MNAVLLIIGTVFSAGLVLMFWSIRHAPCGYQDLSGFNFGTEPTLADQHAVTPAEPTAAVGVTAKSSVPTSLSAEQLEGAVADTKTIRFNSGSEPGKPAEQSLHHAA